MHTVIPIACAMAIGGPTAVPRQVGAGLVVVVAGCARASQSSAGASQRRL